MYTTDLPLNVNGRLSIIHNNYQVCSNLQCEKPRTIYFINYQDVRNEIISVKRKELIDMSFQLSIILTLHNRRENTAHVKKMNVGVFYILFNV